ncbi:MAG: GHKL domain-containing protein [Oscillatoriophycideae cyanobacterium NC_groundwater_1537_Pr4_S-0.65um_50_18]|nr:GHKL domain-containing protein [Oscillatoriophycideae cyanobacterium NC_groundwater_1537_Pr4_S-0.65um_50_18]
MKNSNRLSFASGCLAIAKMPSNPTEMLPVVVQNLAKSLSFNWFWPFFTPRQLPQQGQSWRCMTQREQALAAEVAHYAREVRSLQRQLAEKEHLAAVGALAASIVHEIRNPLTTLWMWLNYCQHQDLSEVAMERLSLALADGDRLQRLLNQILLYAKPQTLQRQELNLNQLVVETLEVFQHTPVALDRKLEFWHSSTPVFLIADPDKLKQVLINLLTNACEAVSDGDSIYIGVKLIGGDRIGLQVHNGGTSISSDQLPKLTEPFYTTKATGTGLGLTIVQQIVEAHAGAIQIESSETHGTTVTVTLPNSR